MRPSRPAVPPDPDRADTAVLSGPQASRSPLTNTQPSASVDTPTRPPPAPPPTISPTDGPVSVPQWPVPGIMPVGPGARIVFEPAKRASGGGVLVILLLMAVAVVGFYFVLPEFVKRGYTSGAERAYGVTLSIDRVVLSFRQIRLLGVMASAREIPGASLRCKEVDLTLNTRLTPTEMVAYDVVVTVDGAYPSLAEAESRWSSAHVSQERKDVGLQRLRIDSGQIAWTRPFGEQTRFQAENITFDAERTEGQALGDDYEVVAPIVDLTDSAGKIGPWKLRVTTAKRIARAIVAFDATGASPAQAVVNVWDGSLASIEVTVPKTPFGQLGIEGPILGLPKAQTFFVEGDAEYTARSAARVDGHIALLASGVRPSGSTTTSEVDVDLRFGGDPKAPIDWGEGAITVGSLRARPTGTVSLTPGSVRAELLWKAGTGRCTGGADASLTTTLRFDSRNLDGSAWTVAGQKCARLP